MVNKKIYAVKKGWKPGLYDQWYGENGAQKQVDGYNGAKHRRFHNVMDAMEWMSGVDLDPMPEDFNPKGYAITLMMIPKGRGEEWAEFVAADIIDAKSQEMAEQEMMEKYWSTGHQSKGTPLFSTLNLKPENEREARSSKFDLDDPSPF